jgi:hypothetical protein
MTKNTMRLQSLTVCLVPALGALAIGAPAQTVASIDQPGTPLLQLKVVPSKEAYTAKETILTETIFTNLSDKTVCFRSLRSKYRTPNRDTWSFTP